MTTYHKSVLLQEVLEGLDVKPGKLYIDATLGGAGHAIEIIKKGGKVLGLDVDDDALTFVKQNIITEIKDPKDLTLVKGNFSHIEELAKKHNFFPVAGILFDLGVSSHQLDTPEKGFSFVDGPLDMRMDTTLGVTAADLVNGLTEKEMVELFERFGEERFSKTIARAIVARRLEAPFTTTSDLAELIKSVVYRSGFDIHPATRVFQALRIAVNDELNVIKEALPQAVSLLESGGRLAVISFHSLEDRIVKQAFVAFKEQGMGEIITKKIVIANEEEIGINRRSRSAKLRVFQKN